MKNNISSFRDVRLNKGQLGLILGERGSGKTACLINIGIEGMLEGLRVLHVSFDDTPTRIESYYEININEVMKSKKIKDINSHGLEIRKTILSYLDQSLDVKRLGSAINNLGTSFDIMLIDGIKREGTNIFYKIKEVATRHKLETWITYPLDIYTRQENKLKDIFDIIFKMYSDHKIAYLLLIKDKEEIAKKQTKLNLNPHTFFIR